MITLYYSLLVLLTVPTMAMLIFMARSPRYRKYLFAIIPIVFLILFKIIYMIDMIKAMPKNSLPEEYFYLHSIEIPQKVIYMWVIEKNKDVPLTVAIPWTQQDSKKLQEAKKSMSEGKMIAGKGKKKSMFKDDETGELLLYKFEIKDVYKKD